MKIAACGKCGAPLEQGSKFCNNCGERQFKYKFYRFHLLIAILRFLWLPLLIMLRVSPDVFATGLFLDPVFSLIALFIAIRANKLRYPLAVLSIILSVFALTGMIFALIVLAAIGYLGAGV